MGQGTRESRVQVLGAWGLGMGVWGPGTVSVWGPGPGGSRYWEFAGLGVLKNVVLFMNIQIQLHGEEICGKNCIFKDNIELWVTQNVPLQKGPPLVIEFFKSNYLERRCKVKNCIFEDNIGV